jgi:hypothetical protein
MLENLGTAEAALSETLVNVSEELANLAPKLGSWSIRECMEHVALAEEYLLNQVLSARHSNTPNANIVRESMILTVGLDRTRHFDAPQVVIPRNRFETLKGAFDHFSLSRARTNQFVQDSLEDPRAMLAEHPRFGTVNNYEMLLMMAVHPHRHVAQIREILETLSAITGPH